MSVTFLLVVVLGVVVVGFMAAVAVAGVVALRNRSSFERDSRLAPGLSTSAPTAWAGSHEPEAKLHRRLRDAIAALSANQQFDDDGRLLDLRVELEYQAVALDEQLVATARLPLPVRREPLERIAGAVETLERAVADLADSSAGQVAARLDAALRDVRTRTGLVAQARAALDALDDEPGELAGADPAAAAPPPPAEPVTDPPTSESPGSGAPPGQPGPS